jgi:DNA-binding NtrC family response regulator
MPPLPMFSRSKKPAVSETNEAVDAGPPDSCLTQTVRFDRGNARSPIWLEVQDKETARMVPILDGQVITVGSSARNSLRIGDAFVSGNHCAIARRHNELVVKDLSSKNGTYVGGARVGEASCGAGTVVVLGESAISFVRSEQASDDEDADARAEAEAAVKEPPLDTVVGGSVPMRLLAERVRRLSRVSVPVLVLGETGTGKELIARALHNEGQRAKLPFVPINVASLPKDLVESELFGHERGAFTGATLTRVGAFEEAAGGTLFLDEIGEFPIDAQPKLLRALDGYGVRRIGSQRAAEIPTARIITATHVHLPGLVLDGRFRRDLYHRLEVFVLRIPPLRERLSDIGPLSRWILKQAQSELGERQLTSRALSVLTAQPWTGNVRELRNTLLRAADACTGKIEAHHIEASLRVGNEGTRVSRRVLDAPLARDILRQCQGNVSRAARMAGLPRTSFRRLVDAVDVDAVEEEK